MALKPSDNAKKYTDADLHYLRDAYYLTEAEMITSLHIFHKKLLSEGCTKRGTEAVITQDLCSYGNSDDLGLIYVSPELVMDIKDYKYGMGRDMS